MKRLLIVLAAAMALSVSVFAEDVVYFASDLSVDINENLSYNAYSDDSETPVYFAYNLYDTSCYGFSEHQNAAWHLAATLYGTTQSPNDYTCSTSSGEFWYYKTNVGRALSSTPAVVFFNTSDVTEIAAAFDTFLNSSQTPAVSSSFTVPSGNVLYFQVSSEQDVDFDANMPRLSSLLFGSQYGPWGNTGIKFGPAAALPTSGTTFPILSQDNIRWFIQPPTNVFGQSKIGTMQKHCLVGQWYALYCPDVFGLNETSADLDSNSTVSGASVNVSGSFSQIKVYPLTSTFDFSDGEFVTSSNDDFSSYFDGSIDENGSVTFTDQDGNVNGPAAGGQNFQDYETDPFALVENIKTILNNILSEIKSLFTFGYDAIQSLVDIMSDFVNVFQQLYAWLPNEVYTALVSAIIVAITIGVFKVFL